MYILIIVTVKHKKLIILSSVVLMTMMILILPSSSSSFNIQKAMAQQQASESTYINQKDGFTLKYPYGWKVVAENFLGVSVLIKPSKNDSTTLFSTITSHINQIDIIDANRVNQSEIRLVLEGIRNNFNPSQYPNANFLEQTTVNIDGHLGFKTILTYDHFVHGKVKAADIQLPVSTRIFVLDYISKPDEFASLAPIFEKITQSFKTLPSK